MPKLIDINLLEQPLDTISMNSYIKKSSKSFVNSCEMKEVSVTSSTAKDLREKPEPEAGNNLKGIFG